MYETKYNSRVTICSNFSLAQGENENQDFKNTDNLKIESTKVVYDNRLEQLAFSIKVKGVAGASVPSKARNLHSAPVLGYVFPTSLKALWNEDNVKDYLNDGVVWHAHWVVLTSALRKSYLCGGDR